MITITIGKGGAGAANYESGNPGQSGGDGFVRIQCTGGCGKLKGNGHSYDFTVSSGLIV